MTYFVVLFEPGPTWNRTYSMRQQEGWDEHARYMDQLAEDGLIVLGGPIGAGGSFSGEHRAMLVFDAPSEEAVRSVLDDDPWSVGRMGVLAIASVEPWQILLMRSPLR